MGFGDKGAKEKQREKDSQKRNQDLNAKEDSQWVDNDKGMKAKEKRAGDKTAGAEEKERRKIELKELEEAEEEANSKLKGASKATAKTKVTRAEVQRNAALLNSLAAAKQPGKTKKTTTVDAPKLEPNLNYQVDVIEASGIDDALAALEVGAAQPVGKMTFKQFEAENSERIKSENAGLKHSQLKEVIWKQWDRSPDNPKNQTTA
eukprot:GEMP01026474.1.p1 GENE.GEMP01026474.1~~GEMP01026474.1.p1  ORF type:complete len:205 (+),score=66.09 GEMP01026474.1:770-1384(+)